MPPPLRAAHLMLVMRGERCIGFSVALSQHAGALRDTFATRLTNRLNTARLFISDYQVIQEAGRPDFGIALHAPTKNLNIIENLVRDVAEELDLVFYAARRDETDVTYGGPEAVHFREDPGTLN